VSWECDGHAETYDRDGKPSITDRREEKKKFTKVTAGQRKIEIIGVKIGR
jgi:hypothetical protein